MFEWWIPGGRSLISHYSNSEMGMFQICMISKRMHMTSEAGDLNDFLLLEKIVSLMNVHWWVLQKHIQHRFFSNTIFVIQNSSSQIVDSQTVMSGSPVIPDCRLPSCRHLKSITKTNSMCIFVDDDGSTYYQKCTDIS